MPKKSQKTLIKCSFCGSSQNEIDFLVEGDDVFICDLCIEKANEALILNNQNSKPKEGGLRKPSAIKKDLDNYIIGQERAKITLSVGVYNHYKRILSKNFPNKVNIEKSNILLVGPTGTGKTLLARTLASILNIPFTIVDATVLTEAGYVGEDVENILVRLYHDSNYDVEKTQRGIIYIDEIDKISRKSSNPSITRDVSGEGVQQSLLKIIEGTTANIPPQGGRKHPEQALIKIDTTDILFICGGTFDGISDVIERRIRGGGMGFERNVQNKDTNHGSLANIKVDDIIKYGFLPELSGRLPIISYLDYLDRKSLFKILKEPANSLVKQYIELFKLDKVELTFNDDALYAIADLALQRKTGARALRSILDEIMLDIMYEIPSNKNIKSCIITKNVIIKNSKPDLKFYKKSA